MKKGKLFIYLGLFYIISGCVKNNPDPSWLKINEWTLEANSNVTPGTAGVLTHSFTDARVYINGQLLGIFELPCKIPVLASGATQIIVMPTIRDNGISATKKAYPFMEKYTLNATLEKNQTLEINPITRYYSTTHFWIEDFEDPVVKLDEDANNTAHLEVDNTSSILQYGSAGHIHLSDSLSDFLAYTSEALSLSKGEEIYLEIDYYNTNPLITGVRGFLVDNSYLDNLAIQMNSQDKSSVKWKKIYISLSEIVTNLSNTTNYKISLKSIFSGSDQFSDVYIDNIKVVW